MNNKLKISLIFAALLATTLLSACDPKPTAVAEQSDVTETELLPESTEPEVVTEESPETLPDLIPEASTEPTTVPPTEPTTLPPTEAATVPPTEAATVPQTKAVASTAIIDTMAELVQSELASAFEDGFQGSVKVSCYAQENNTLVMAMKIVNFDFLRTTIPNGKSLSDFALEELFVAMFEDAIKSQNEIFNTLPAAMRDIGIESPKFIVKCLSANGDILFYQIYE